MAEYCSHLRRAEAAHRSGHYGKKRDAIITTIKGRLDFYLIFDLDNLLVNMDNFDRCAQPRLKIRGSQCSPIYPLTITRRRQIADELT